MKKRNSHAVFKAGVRRLVEVSADDDVLDLFAGDGAMYRAIWDRAGSGATLDNDDACVARAAVERDRWTVLRCDAEKALRGGAWSWRPFSVVDVDCYGSPWRFVEALFACDRRLANGCSLVLTDHYMTCRNIGGEDKALRYKKPDTPEAYLRRVDWLLGRTAGAQGWTWTRRLFRDGKAVQHLIQLRRDA